jgi:integrase
MAKQKNPKGQGYYYKQGDYFYWRLVRDGKTIVRSALTSKELEIKVKSVLGSRNANDKTLVSEYFGIWLKEIESLNDIPTYNQYESIYRNNIDPVIGDYKVSSIKPSDIRKVISTMNTKVVERKDKNGVVASRKVGLSEKTMKHARFIMNTVFARAAEEDKIIEGNPVKKLKIPKKQSSKQKVLSVPELVAYFKAISTSRWVWSVWLNLVTGLRRGELTALRSSDIDWDNNRIIINKSNSVHGLSGTKNKKDDFIFLTRIALSILDKQFEMLKNECNPAILNNNGTMKSGYKNEDFLLFPTEKGEMIKPNTYYHTIVRFAEKAGVKAHPHCFRHTFTYFLRNKISLKELQNALRHEASTSTLDIYGNMIDDMNDETAMTMDNVFSKVEDEIEKGLFESNKKSNIVRLDEWEKAK